MAPRNTRVTPEVEVRSPARSFMQTLDNFYAPARDTRSERAFQEGLDGFSAILGEKAEEAKKERNEGEYQQGIQDAIREQAGQELEGVKTGSIFRQHSKYYMMGLNETRGKAAASKFKNDLTLAYEQWEGKHTDDDGSAFREWMNTQVANFTNTLGDNQYYIAGAMPTVNEVARNFAVQHTGFTANRLEVESMEAYDEIVSGIFSDMSNGNLDFEGAVDRLAGEADDMYNMDGAAANNRVVEAAIRYANIHNDPDALLAMAKAHDSGKLKLSQVNREKLANAMDAVEADIQRETNRQNSEETAAAKAAQEAALNTYAQMLEENPYAPLPKFSDVGDHSTYAAMVRLSESFQKAGEVTNPVVDNVKRMGFEAELADAANSREKIGILSDYITQNPTALSQADVSRYMQEFTAHDDPGNLVNNPLVGKYRKGFGETLGAFQEGASWSIDQVSVFKTQGQRHFDDFLLSKAGTIDLNDPTSIRTAIKEAEEYAMEQLAFDFPKLMKDRTEERPAEAQVLGSQDALDTRQQAIEAEAESVYNNLAGVEGAEASAEGDLSVEDQPEPFDDPDSDEAYTPTRAGFYGELIQRFTDGEDTRNTVLAANDVLNSDPEFASAINRLGQKYNISPTALLAVMDFETGGTFSTTVKNAAGSGATGLIQFMPKTAASLGTTTEALANMSRGEQMVYVEKYFDQFAGRIQGGNVNDIYMAVLWPKAIGKDDGFVIFRRGTTAYTQNAGLDTNKDGTVTKFEAAAKVRQRFYDY